MPNEDTGRVVFIANIENETPRLARARTAAAPPTVSLGEAGCATIGG
jgi:hypothetical protein